MLIVLSISCIIVALILVTGKLAGTVLDFILSLLSQLFSSGCFWLILGVLVFLLLFFAIL